MPSPVPPQPTPADLDRLQVKQLVSGDHARRWAADINFLRGHVAQPVAAIDVQNSATSTTPVDWHFFYSRSGGIRVLMIAVEIGSASTTDGGRLYVEVTLPAGASWVEGAAGGLDGTVAFATPGAFFLRRPKAVGYVDVSGLTVGALNDIKITTTVDSGEAGLARATIVEVPLADVRVEESPTGEVGVSSSWPLPPNRLVAGTASTSLGFARLQDQMHRCRTENRRHLQGFFGGTTTSTSYAYLGPGTLDYRFWMRTRRVYQAGSGAPSGFAQGNRYTFACRYLTQSNAVDASAQLLVGGVAHTNLTLPASATSTTYVTASTTLYLPTTSDQEVELTFKGKTNNAASQLTVYDFALIEAEQ
jgi:hypothetical protein